MSVYVCDVNAESRSIPMKILSISNVDLHFEVKKTWEDLKELLRHNKENMISDFEFHY